MTSNIDPATERYLSDLGKISDRLDRAQRELSSGKKILVVSDAPDQISSLLETRAQLARVQQVQTNLNLTKTQVDTSEQSLESAAKLLDNASSLGAQGATGTQTTESRASLANEVDGVLSQLVGISQTTVDGRYVFSGNADQSNPYTLDLTQDNPISTYGGGQATSQTQRPGGSTFPTALTAQDIFDNADPTKNVFQAVNNLRLALRADDQTAIENAVTQIGTASKHLNTELSFYGTVQNQVSSATNDASTAEVRLRTELSSIEDADATQAIVDLNQATIQQQAALQTYAKIPRKSLFDYLA